MGLQTLQGICAKASRFYSNSELDEGGIDEIYQVLEVAGLLPEVLPLVRKSDVAAEKLRVAGNRAFVESKNDINALQLYTKAICIALPDAKEIAMAYANRSAVTFALREYRNSINDIERALAGQYPKHLRCKLVERRGRCYLELKKYHRAFSDFSAVKNLVEECGDDEEIKRSKIARLEELIEKCCGMKDATEAPLTSCPSTTHPPSPYIECASNAVEIAYSDQMGRHVVSSVDILPGDVLAVEKPFASILLPPNYSLYCEHCKRRCHSALPCVQCTEIVFCDENCRQKSWSMYHSVECNAIPSLIAIGCDKMEFLALRTLLVASRKGHSFKELINRYPMLAECCPNPRMRGFVGGKYLSSDYSSTHYLENHRNIRDSKDIFRRSVTAVCLLHILKIATDFFENCNLSSESEALGYQAAGKLMLTYLMSVPCNAHEIAEMRLTIASKGKVASESVEIGGAIYPFHSLINHSCDPNVVRHAFNGDTVVLTAIQLIRKGEQIFDNYGYHHAVHDLATRQEHLWSQYYFSCSCPACEEDWPLYRDLPEGPPQLTNLDVAAAIDEKSRQFTEMLATITKNQSSEEDFVLLKEYLLLLHCNVKRPWKEYNKCQEAIKQHLSLRANCFVYYG
ncbi:unnamed protein product [Nesidiocoris tenuis]|uniref:SET domain n=2 Tax=Nesidiocoris tenuis TaxID=355587 RepID=A0ABN7AP98_9HEMI|nr:SET domain [Nesidiocoris tenuis]CAB0017276.1 unnamed protein product [Nesidiocoris tenuis]